MANLYESVLASGGGVTPTPITPSNSSPASMTAGTDYEPTANGYAIESYTELDPSNGEPWPTITSGTIYKAVDNGYAIESVNTVTPSNSNPLNLRPHAIYSIDENYREGGYLVQSEPTALTPSNSSPPSIANGTIYKGGGSGYAIASYQSKTPSASGTAFDAGFVKMSQGGYAYSAKPTPTETTLWTNSNPTANFNSQDITLSQSMRNFDYLKVTYKLEKTSSDVLGCAIKPVSEIVNTVSQVSTGDHFGISIGYYGSGARLRLFQYKSDTSLGVSGNIAVASSSTTDKNNQLIPMQIIGIKMP